MESNKDEALRCLSIAQKHYDSGNLQSARKFCQKSKALFETSQADKLLAAIDSAAASSSSSTSTAKSQAEEHPSAAGMKHRSAQSANTNGTAGGMGGEKREYTHEQHTVVKRVRACKVTEYYEILAVSKDCDEADIKKAYRKLALALHPDKNGAPGADEAFKLVSKAFQVLSDSQKRAIYDRSGSDPEDRSGGMRSRSSGFATSPFGNGDGELSPEDLFNMFFGGGGGGGFGGGPAVFTTSFGNGGFRTHTFRTTPRQANNRADTEPRSVLIQLLPLLLLFGFSLLSALPNLFSTPPVPDPRFSFTGTPRYNAKMETGGLGVPYYVNPGEFSSHPMIGAELAKDGRGRGKKRGSALAKFEDGVDRIYTQDLYAQCQHGVNRKERLKEAEVGIFGIGTDWKKVEEIEKEVVPSCEELRRLGV
ncbi:uncharacterized protein LACBIDRAFT_152282, partial [Laccaria bicolor S238N-H82]